jgi:periplasmic mercuric ion binding protein
VGGAALAVKELPMRISLATLILLLMPLAAAAAPQTAVLDVQNMTCGLCPVTVKKSLEKVPGVSQARVDFQKKTATVTFDADKTNASALVKATTNAGFPSTVQK